MKVRFGSRILLLLAPLLLASLVACGGTGDDQPATLPTESPSGQGAEPLSPGDRMAVDDFANRLKAVDQEWDGFQQEFDGWRAGLTSCHRSSVHEALQGFARGLRRRDGSGRGPSQDRRHPGACRHPHHGRRGGRGGLPPAPGPLAARQPLPLRAGGAAALRLRPGPEERGRHGTGAGGGAGEGRRPRGEGGTERVLRRPGRSQRTTGTSSTTTTTSSKRTPVAWARIRSSTGWTGLSHSSNA